MATVLRLANADRRTIAAAQRGVHRLRLSTARKWDLAVTRALGGRDGDAVQFAVASVVVHLAGAGRLDPRAILGHDLSVQRPNNKQWLEAAQLRRCAVYLLVVEFGFERSAIGRALGCSRQAIAQAITWAEERCDADPALRALLAGVRRLFP